MRCNMLHARKYKKIMASQQSWYLLLSYFNNKINFLFSCEIRFEVCISVNLTYVEQIKHKTIH